MSLVRAFLVLLVRLLAFFLLRFDRSEMRRIPREGPFILAMNHVNFLDGPLLLAGLYPRRVGSLAKKETWKNPLMGLIASASGAIPLDRGLADPAALRKAAALLESGGFLYINPEGTRSRDGILKSGKAGVVSLALATGAPVLPLAFVGLEGFGPGLRRLRRARVVLRVGEPFRLLPPGEAGLREARQEALEEIMARIAALLPPEKRGEHGARMGGAFRRTETLSAL